MSPAPSITPLPAQPPARGTAPPIELCAGRETRPQRIVCFNPSILHGVFI